MDEFILNLGLVLLVCKCFALLSRRFGAPQVVGEIIGGLLLGPCFLNIMQSNDTFGLFAEIGVLLLMFSTGLATDLKELMKTGKIAFLLACAGVFIPLVAGTLLYSCFYGFAAVGTKEFYSAVFIGTIMTATSVSITVATLQELGKISTTLGTTIVSAAIIDDVIGMIVLTCVIGAASGSKGGITAVFVKTALFFVFAFVIGIIANRVMGKLDDMHPHTQRIPIFALASCLLMAYIAEKYFGIADITGAYIMGVALASVKDSKYIGRKMDISAYMVFAPIFFANIGLQTNLKTMSKEMLIFSLLFVVVALAGKVIGCGLVAKASGYKNKESLIAGIGMMTRGEVALIVAQKGLAIKLIDSSYFSCVILLIIISSIATPILLKRLFKSMEEGAVEASI